MKSRTLSPDAQVTLLLSSRLALPTGPATARVHPLSPSEWNELAAVLVAHELRPGALLGMDSSAIQSQLGLQPDYADRVG